MSPVRTMSDRPAKPYLDDLNPEQRDAVTHFEGPILVLAGAGSGKTRVLTTRVAHLVNEHGVPTERILAVTFTNKAAGEMRERIGRLLGSEPAGMWISTFHAMGARLLRRHAPLLGWSRSFSIFDAEQSQRQLKNTQLGLNVDPKRWRPQAVRSQISAAKNQLVTPKRFVEEHGDGSDPFLRTVARVYPAYQAALADQDSFDFDDLLVKPVELFERDSDLLERYRRRFVFVLVDEYQDTNRSQFRFLELLAAERGNLMVVGDDDQSIYGWRGADISNILDFERSYVGARTVRLERNYRSTQRILEAANAVIAENRQRKGKTLRTEREGGEPVTLFETVDENDEARTVVGEIEARYRDGPGLYNYRSFAVLYRTNAQARALEDGLRRRGVPYQVVGGTRFYERREIQDVLAYLRLVSNPRDRGAFERVVNYPRRGVGDKTLERLRAFAAEQGLSLLEAADRGGECGAHASAANGLRDFAELIARFSARASNTRVGRLLDDLVEELDLLQQLRAEGPEGEDRAENVKELVAGALDFDGELEGELEAEELDPFTELDLYLQRVALVADVDAHDPEADAVTLMTLHNAKGLEFPVVFITGLEDGLFPLSRAYDDPHELEEERRLFYVGVTRAKDKLVLSHARQRRRAGDYVYGRLSPFADSIPDELVESASSPLLDRIGASSTPHRGRGRRAPPDHTFDPDPALDSAFNQAAPRFVKGERVSHPTFGSGSIMEVSGFGRDTRVTVHFDSVGRKKLVIRYAGLERDLDF